MDITFSADNNKDYILGNEENNWAIITSFFDQKGLVRQQLDSFNQFVKIKMQEIIDENSIISVKSIPTAGNSIEREIKLYFGQISILGPPINTEIDGTSSKILPNEARLRDLTYWVNMFIDVKKAYYENGIEVDVSKTIRVPFGSLPVMVKSELCALKELNDKDNLKIYATKMNIEE